MAILYGCRGDRPAPHVTGPVTSDDKIALDSRPDRVTCRGSGGDQPATPAGASPVETLDDMTARDHRATLYGLGGEPLPLSTHQLFRGALWLTST